MFRMVCGGSWWSWWCFCHGVVMVCDVLSWFVMMFRHGSLSSWFVMFVIFHCHGFVMVHCHGFVMVHCHGLSWFTVMVSSCSSWFTVMVRHGSSWFVMVRHGSLSWFVMVHCHGSLSWFVMVHCHGFVMVRDVLFSKILQKKVM